MALSRKKIQDDYYKSLSRDMQINKSGNRNKFKTVLTILVILWFVSFLVGKFASNEVGDKVAIIPIEGTIMGSSSSFPFSNNVVDSKQVVELIEKAGKSKSVKAVILEINSPGGTVVASKEIADAVKEFEKPIVSVIREVGTSGAYWVASASDYIYADEMSLTGSIGVNGGFLEFSGLMDEYGVSYQELKGGKFKDVGNPYESLSEEERKIIQIKIDLIHDSFISNVAENRGMEFDDVKKVSEGLYYLGVEAMELGLIDGFGNTDDAVDKAEELTGIDELNEVRYEIRDGGFSILDLISTKSSYNIGRGIGDSLGSNAQINSRVFVPYA